MSRFPPDDQSVRDVTGWVYFAGAYDGDNLQFVKIGYTSAKNPNKRVDAVAEGVPHDVRLLAAVPGCLALEALYHREFSKWRVRGEWFRLSGELECRIDTINAMRGPWYGKKKKSRRGGR